MNNGVSKKLCITAVGIAVVTQLAAGAEDKLPYAIVIGCMCITYKLVQGWIDGKSKEQ